MLIMEETRVIQNPDEWSGSENEDDEICQRLIQVSFAKIVSSKNQRGGAKLHKNLLILHLLQQARYEQRRSLSPTDELVDSEPMCDPVSTIAEPSAPLDQDDLESSADNLLPLEQLNPNQEQSDDFLTEQLSESLPASVHASSDLVLCFVPDPDEERDLVDELDNDCGPKVIVEPNYQLRFGGEEVIDNQEHYQIIDSQRDIDNQSQDNTASEEFSKFRATRKSSSGYDSNSSSSGSSSDEDDVILTTKAPISPTRRKRKRGSAYYSPAGDLSSAPNKRTCIGTNAPDVFDNNNSPNCEDSNSQVKTLISVFNAGLAGVTNKSVGGAKKSEPPKKTPSPPQGSASAEALTRYISIIKTGAANGTLRELVCES